jgi:hypothetical protein
MENKTTVGLIIIIGVALLLGSIVIQIISEQTTAKTKLTAVVYEPINIAPARSGELWAMNNSYNLTIVNYPQGWRLSESDCSSITNYVFYNQSKVALTIGTHYGFSPTTGQFYYLNGTAPAVNATATNTTYVSYSYCPNDYLNSGWGRAVANNTVGFFSLAILISAAFVIFFILKKEGVELNI